MLETLKAAIAHTTTFISNLDPLIVGLFMFGALFAWLFFAEHKSGKLDWTDLVTGKGTTKVSLTKLLQLLGGVTATWVVMFQTIHNQLATELFFAYLLYVASIEGYSKFMAARYGVSDSPNDVTARANTSTNPPPQ